MTIIRTYLEQSTRTHRHTKVKPQWAELVLSGEPLENPWCRMVFVFVVLRCDVWMRCDVMFAWVVMFSCVWCFGCVLTCLVDLVEFYLLVLVLVLKLMTAVVCDYCRRTKHEYSIEYTFPPMARVAGARGARGARAARARGRLRGAKARAPNVRRRRGVYARRRRRGRRRRRLDTRRRVRAPFRDDLA